MMPAMKQSMPIWGESGAAGPVAGNAISRNPLIFWGPAATEYPIGPASSLADSIGNRRAYFLISPSWHREDPAGVAADRDLVRAAQTKYPEHRFLFLVSNRKELQNYRDVGLPAFICLYTVFVDETMFDIDPTAPKRFDAIYNAAIAPYKRHELASTIRNLGLLYYRHEYFSEHEAAHVNKIRALLAGATWINELENGYRQFEAREIPAWLNQARVGLCLSPYEGPMRASAEYLLCGLPIVSTPNIGGRDRLADARYWTEAEPEPAAIAAAVDDMVARRIDPHLVRRSTLEKLQGDRQRLVKVIAAIFAEESVPFPKDADWIQLFRRGTWPFKTEAMILSELAIAETRTR
jgi:glycosyltransferase involved in cell wall biosynthesis